jgi:hypothetical protein
LSVLAQAGGCSTCCCCCCLHSLGALIGAAVGSLQSDQSEGESETGLPASGLSAAALFWLTFPILAMVGMVLGLLDGSLDWMVVIVVLALPAFQIGAAIVVAFILAVSARRDKDNQYRQLGNIAAGVVAGTGFGILAMLGIYLLVRFLGG